ncbi:hypothetical protein AWB73_06558 [Caballeronia turbans]|nr:hypothetical protein AWB73_06558 [Caballeronia turbans]
MTPSRHAASPIFWSGGSLEARVPLKPAPNGDAGKSGIRSGNDFTAGKPHIVAPHASTLARRDSAVRPSSIMLRAYFLRASQSASRGGESFAAISSYRFACEPLVHHVY